MYQESTRTRRIQFEHKITPSQRPQPPQKISEKKARKKINVIKQRNVLSVENRVAYFSLDFTSNCFVTRWTELLLVISREQCRGGTDSRVFHIHTEMPILACSSLLHENKNSSDKMLPRVGIEPK